MTFDLFDYELRATKNKDANVKNMTWSADWRVTEEESSQKVPTVIGAVVDERIFSSSSHSHSPLLPYLVGRTLHLKNNNIGTMVKLYPANVFANPPSEFDDHVEELCEKIRKVSISTTLIPSNGDKYIVTTDSFTTRSAAALTLHLEQLVSRRQKDGARTKTP